MGEDFWGTLKASVFFQYLKGKGVTADTYWFSEVLQKMYTTSLGKMKSQGTLNAVPFDRKPEITVTPRNKKTKLKLPPEAYSIKKKKETPTQSIANHIKQTSKLKDSTSVGEAAFVNSDGTVRSRSSKSSKSSKSNTASPLSGKYNSEDALPEPEPVLEHSTNADPPAAESTSRWFGKLFAGKKSQANEKSPSSPLPALSIPDAAGSSTESGGAPTLQRSGKYADASNISSSEAKNRSPPSPKKKLFSTFNAMMSSSSSTPSLSGNTPSSPMSSLPKLFSRDDSPERNKSEENEKKLTKRHTLTSLHAGGSESTSSAPSSPRESRDRMRSEKRLESPRDGGMVQSPRRSVKLEKIASKNTMGTSAV